MIYFQNQTNVSFEKSLLEQMIEKFPFDKALQFQNEVKKKSNIDAFLHLSNKSQRDEEYLQLLKRLRTL